MNGPSPQLPSGPGSYALLIRLESPQAVAVGRLGRINFDAGWYVYVGSAQRGLAGRVNRHMRQHKKLHWHVDYLLERATLSEVIWALSDERLECRIANALQRQGVVSSISRFGASDCRCPSHLFHSPNPQALRDAVTHAFTSLDLTPSPLPLSQ